MAGGGHWAAVGHHLCSHRLVTTPQPLSWLLRFPCTMPSESLWPPRPSSPSFLFSGSGGGGMEKVQGSLGWFALWLRGFCWAGSDWPPVGVALHVR